MMKARSKTPTTSLETRYRELLGRYRLALERINESLRAESAFHRLSWFALQRSSSAVAMFREGRVVLANPRWHELSRHRGNPAGWAIGVGAARRVYPDLGTLGATELERLPAATPATLLCARRDGDEVLRLRLERVTRAGEDSIGLLLADDVTDEHAREAALADLHDELTRGEQMAALGRLAAGVAHDLGNTLGALALRVERIARLAEGEARQHVPAIQEAVAIMRETLDRLSSFGEQRAPKLEPIDLRQAIRSALDVAGLSLDEREHVTVALTLPRRVPRVLAAERELVNVLVNLLVNAREAMDGRGAIAIAARANGERVQLIVADEGPGFPAEHLPRVFEPFFTTKGAHGHGLGLSLAYGFAQSIGGSIAARNREGGGAELVLELPIAGASVVAARSVAGRSRRRKRAK